jgi:predicted permease
MLAALLATYITKAPAWIQGGVFGLCVGLFVAAGAEADTRNAVISSVILLVLTVGVIAGGMFFFGLRARLRRLTDGGDAPAWVHASYCGTWLLSVAAAVRALFGEGGFKIAALAILIVLLAQPALVGIRALLRTRHEGEATPATASALRPIGGHDQSQDRP